MSLELTVGVSYVDEAVSTSRLVLVPYSAHHVPKYHEWMKDPVRIDTTSCFHSLVLHAMLQPRLNLSHFLATIFQLAFVFEFLVQNPLLKNEHTSNDHFFFIR